MHLSLPTIICSGLSNRRESNSDNAPYKGAALPVMLRLQTLPNDTCVFRRRYFYAAYLFSSPTLLPAAFLHTIVLKHPSNSVIAENEF